MNIANTLRTIQGRSNGNKLLSIFYHILISSGHCRNIPLESGFTYNIQNIYFEQLYQNACVKKISKKQNSKTLCLIIIY